jgi:hypothetical protein
MGNVGGLTMITLDKYEQQVILACKSWGKWAKQSNRFKAVQVVVSQYYAIPLDELPMITMYHCLLELFIKINKNRESLLKNFLWEIFKEDWTGKYKEEIDMEHIVRKLISRLSETPVQDDEGNKYFEEIEPDYKILNKGI